MNEQGWTRRKGLKIRRDRYSDLESGRFTGLLNHLGKRLGNYQKRLPESEKYLLRDQISRAADSICLNIAEGSNKLSDIDFSRYLNNSETSLEEVVCCLNLILEDGYISEEEFGGSLKEAEDLGAQLIAFGKKVRQNGTRL